MNDGIGRGKKAVPVSVWLPEDPPGALRGRSKRLEKAPKKGSTRPRKAPRGCQYGSRKHPQGPGRPEELAEIQESSKRGAKRTITKPESS